MGIILGATSVGAALFAALHRTVHRPNWMAGDQPIIAAVALLMLPLDRCCLYQIRGPRFRPSARAISRRNVDETAAPRREFLLSSRPSS